MNGFRNWLYYWNHIYEILFQKNSFFIPELGHKQCRYVQVQWNPTLVYWVQICGWLLGPRYGMRPSVKIIMFIFHSIQFTQSKYCLLSILKGGPIKSPDAKQRHLQEGHSSSWKEAEKSIKHWKLLNAYKLNLSNWVIVSTWCTLIMIKVCNMTIKQKDMK